MAVAAGVFCVQAAPQDVTPVVERQVQPVWGPELEKDYIVENAKVTLVIDAHGQPFSAAATSGLPDNVVKSLSTWHFRPGKKDGKNQAFSIFLSVPVRNALTPAYERSMRRRWLSGTRKLDDDIRAGFVLEATGLSGLQQALESDPQNAEARATLLAYAATKQGAAQPEELARHVRI